MKKTITTLAVLGIVAAVPAFAADNMQRTSTQKTVYTQQTTFRNVKVPLTAEQVAERQQMGTKIEQSINRLDTNGDRELNRAEYSYGSHLFDINNDDKAVAFYNIDANHDGNLSSQELLKAELAERENTVTIIEPASGTRVQQRTVIVRE